MGHEHQGQRALLAIQVLQGSAISLYHGPDRATGLNQGERIQIASNHQTGADLPLRLHPLVDSPDQGRRPGRGRAQEERNISHQWRGLLQNGFQPPF